MIIYIGFRKYSDPLLHTCCTLYCTSDLIFIQYSKTDIFKNSLKIKNWNFLFTKVFRLFIQYLVDTFWQQLKLWDLLVLYVSTCMSRHTCMSLYVSTSFEYLEFDSLSHLFMAYPLKLHHFGWKASVNSHLQVSPQLFDRV